MFETPLMERAAALIEACRTAAVTLVTAESCTGGLLSGLLTEIAGASAVVERGFVTYSNLAKMEMLGVPERVLAEHGAVSSPTAIAMANGALDHSTATIAISVTGIAGPGGATSNKPVGLVCFGLAIRGGAFHAVEQHFGDIGRGRVRRAAIGEALGLIEAAVKASGAAGGQSRP